MGVSAWQFQHTNGEFTLIRTAFRLNHLLAKLKDKNEEMVEAVCAEVMVGFHIFLKQVASSRT